MESSIVKEGENEFTITGKSVKSWAYKEDTNYKFRAGMEDSHVIIDGMLYDETKGLFAIMDGHGGIEAVEYCKNRLALEFQKQLNECSSEDIFEIIETCFQKLDDQLRIAGAIASGCTMTLCYIHNEDSSRVLYTANVGDSKACILSTSGVVEQLTVDHKPSDVDELNRIKGGGGFVFRGRVAGQLAVSRALGDHQLKNEGVISKPSINRKDLGGSDRYVVIASDGLWDVIQNQDLPALIAPTSKEFCDKLLMTSLEKGTRDNVSVLVIEI